MASNYPTSLDSIATNKTDALPATNDHATHHNDLADAVNKIEAELGINPSGSSVDLTTRFNTLAVSLIPTSVKTANYTAVPNDYVPVDTTSANVTVTLPTAPSDGTRIGVKMIIQASGHTVTIARGGTDVFNKTGGGTSLTLSLLNQAMILQYKSSTGIWYVTSDDLALSQLDSRYASGSAGLLNSIAQPNTSISIDPATGDVVFTTNSVERARVTNVGSLTGLLNPGPLSGATATVRFVGGTTSGSPVSGTFQVGDFIVTQDGHIFICVVAGSPGTWVNVTAAPVTVFYRDELRNAGLGILAESFPFSASTGSTSTTGSTGVSASMYLEAIGLRNGDVVTGGIAFQVGAASGATLAKLGLFKSDGTFLRATADVKASLAAGVYLQQPFTSTYTVPADGLYYVALLTLASTTQPTFLRGVSVTGGGASLTGGVPRSAAVGASDISGNVTPSGNGTTNHIWMAVY